MGAARPFQTLEGAFCVVGLAVVVDRQPSGPFRGEVVAVMGGGRHRHRDVLGGSCAGAMAALLDVQPENQLFLECSGGL